jgi:hypothetical protein
VPNFDNQDKVLILGKDPSLSPAGADVPVLLVAGAGITAVASLAAAQPGTAAANVARSCG